MSNPPNNTIYQYVRNRKRQKIGVVAAVKRSDGLVGFGYSLCAVKKGDEFNRVRALEIALGRAEAFPYFECETIPQSIVKDWSEIYDRAVRYFKGDEIA